MDDRSVAKFGLLMAVIGAIGMFSINLLLVPTVLSIGDIDQGRLGQIVAVDADIKRISIKDDDVFVTLFDGTGEIRAVVWGNVARGSGAYNLSVGDAVLVTGQVASYRGELEIVVSKIEK